MEITIQLPDVIAHRLATAPSEIPRRVLEVVALESYRQEQLSEGQVAVLLGLSRWETEAFLDQHNARRPYTKDMLEEDRRTLAHLPPK